MSTDRLSLLRGRGRSFYDDAAGFLEPYLRPDQWIERAARESVAVLPVRSAVQREKLRIVITQAAVISRRAAIKLRTLLPVGLGVDAAAVLAADVWLRERHGLQMRSLGDQLRVACVFAGVLAAMLAALVAVAWQHRARTRALRPTSARPVPIWLHVFDFAHATIAGLLIAPLLLLAYVLVRNSTNLPQLWWIDVLSGAFLAAALVAVAWLPVRFAQLCVERNAPVGLAEPALLPLALAIADAVRLESRREWGDVVRYLSHRLESVAYIVQTGPYTRRSPRGELRNADCRRALMVAGHLRQRIVELGAADSSRRYRAVIRDLTGDLRDMEASRRDAAKLLEKVAYIEVEDPRSGAWLLYRLAPAALFALAAIVVPLVPAVHEHAASAAQLRISLAGTAVLSLLRPRLSVADTFGRIVDRKTDPTVSA